MSRCASSSRGHSANSGDIKYYHKLEAKLKNVRKGPNAGEKLYACPNWPNGDCSFFEWVKEVKFQDDADVMLGRLADLKAQCGILDEKMRNFDAKEDEMKSAMAS